MKEFSTDFFSKPNQDPQESEDLGLMNRLRKSKIAQAGLVVVGLHGVPIAQDYLKEKTAYAAEQNKRWTDPDAVLRPQSDAVRKVVEKNVEERVKRKDEDGLKAYKQEMADRLDRGEDVSFEEAYFKQAELNGVTHEDVEKAKKVVAGMVQHFSSKLEGGLTDGEIKEISHSMFATAEYEWGQGNVVDYFLYHKRNCVAIDQAQEIVFEKLIQRLPEDQRGRYQLGKRYENQHVIAMMGVAQSSDLPPHHYVALQSPYGVELSGRAPAGTATVSVKQVKSALAGKKVVVKSVEPKKGEPEVHSGPYIDAVVNQPVDDGIVVEGKLRSAVANERQAHQEGVLPMTGSEYNKKYSNVMEIELRIEDPNDQSHEEAKRRLDNARMMSVNAYPITVDYRSFKKPASSDVFNGRESLAIPLAKDARFVFGDLKEWDANTVDILTAFNAEELSIALDADGKLNEDFARSIERRTKAEVNQQAVDMMEWRVVELRQSSEAKSKGLDMVSLKNLLFSLKEYQKTSQFVLRHDLKLDVEEITDETLSLIQKYPPTGLHLTKRVNGYREGHKLKNFSYSIDRLKKLGIPVYIEVDDFNLGKDEGYPPYDYNWLMDDSDLIFPEFSSILRAATLGLNENNSTFKLSLAIFSMSNATKWESQVSNYEHRKSYIIGQFMEALQKNIQNGRRFSPTDLQQLNRFYRIATFDHWATLFGNSDERRSLSNISGPVFELAMKREFSLHFSFPSGALKINLVSLNSLPKAL